MRILNLSPKLSYDVCERNGVAKYPATPFSSAWKGRRGVERHIWDTELGRIATLW
jgi:hypothetical protein